MKLSGGAHSSGLPTCPPALGRNCPAAIYARVLSPALCLPGRSGDRGLRPVSAMDNPSLTMRLALVAKAISESEDQ